MFCISGFILFDGIGEKPCAEHHESNSSKVKNSTGNIFHCIHRVQSRSLLPKYIHRVLALAVWG